MEKDELDAMEEACSVYHVEFVEASQPPTWEPAWYILIEARPALAEAYKFQLLTTR